MKTLEEANGYLDSIDTWDEDGHPCADPGERHVEFYNFKKTIDLSGRELNFVKTDADMAYLPDARGYVNDDITWVLRLPDFGWVHLHLYCTPDVEDMGYYSEFWMEKEPWWNGDDPYECTDDQIAVIVQGLPDEHRARFEELASRSETLMNHFRESGILKGPDPKP